MPTATVLPGLTVDGAPVPLDADAAQVRAHVERRARTLEVRRVDFIMPAGNDGAEEVVLRATLRDLGVEVDIDRTVAAALRAGKAGDVFTRLGMARRARRGPADHRASDAP